MFLSQCLSCAFVIGLNVVILGIWCYGDEKDDESMSKGVVKIIMRAVPLIIPSPSSLSAQVTVAIFGVPKVVLNSCIRSLTNN